MRHFESTKSNADLGKVLGEPVNLVVGYFFADDFSKLKIVESDHAMPLSEVRVSGLAKAKPISLTK